MKGSARMTISWDIYKDWGNQPILHDEDEWGGKYKTYAEMWEGEGYTIGAANIVGFSDQELELISEGVVRLIRDNCEAKKLVTAPSAVKMIDNSIAVLQYLNTKICNYMEG